MILVLNSIKYMMDFQELSRNNNTSSKRRKTDRKEILQKKKANEEAMKVALAEKDPLCSFPGFRFYSTDGLSVYLESMHSARLSSTLKKHILNLLKVNMERPYGPEWPTEEKVKRKEMVAPEARYIFVHETFSSNPSDSLLNSNARTNSSKYLQNIDQMVGFIHYRFVMEEEVPVLYVYELQLESRVQGKGLGKFLMELIELIAQKNRMGAVLLTVQKRNSGATSFYMSKLRYLVSTISPSRVNPMVGVTKSYEILCKTFNHEAKAILEENLLV